jgi:hypothetical protein
MKKPFLFLVIFLLIIALIPLGFFDSLMIFLLAGQVPGTHYTVPPSFMLLATLGILWLLVLRFTAFELFQAISLKRSAKQKPVQHEKRLPKRRFSRI